MKDGVREFNLDVEVHASGFTKGERRALESYMDQIGGGDEEGSDEEDESEEHSDASDEEDEEEEEEDEVAREVVEGEEDEAPPNLDGLRIGGPDEKDGEEGSGEGGSEDEEDDDELDAPVAHRRHRPSKRAPQPTAADVGSSELFSSSIVILPSHAES